MCYIALKSIRSRLHVNNASMVLTRADHYIRSPLNVMLCVPLRPILLVQYVFK